MCVSGFDFQTVGRSSRQVDGSTSISINRDWDKGVNFRSFRVDLAMSFQLHAWPGGWTEEGWSSDRKNDLWKEKNSSLKKHSKMVVILFSYPRGLKSRSVRFPCSSQYFTALSPCVIEPKWALHKSQLCHPSSVKMFLTLGPLFHTRQTAWESRKNSTHAQLDGVKEVSKHHGRFRCRHLFIHIRGGFVSASNQSRAKLASNERVGVSCIMWCSWHWYHFR